MGQEASGGQGKRSPEDVDGNIPSGKGDVGEPLGVHQ